MNVNSSFISAIKWSVFTNILIVNFKNGKIARYSDVPIRVWLQLATAQSKGTYFNLNIKPKYKAL